MTESAVQGAGPRPGATRLLSDTRLSRRAAAGDQRAFAAIFRRYHQDLYRYCVAILGNSQDAQDALQNTMVKVLAALPGEQREIQLKPWLYRIAHNEAIDLRRTQRPVEPLEADVPVLTGGPAETLELQGRIRDLLTDIEALPERQRGALVMRELSGLSFEQIGSAFDTSPAVARQTVYEARLSLQRMREGREMDCAAVTKALSDGDGRLTRRRELRAHLRSCSECRRFEEGLQQRERDLAVIAPLPAVAAAGLLQGLIGGGNASGGLLAALGAVTGKSVAGSVIAKSAATVAAVAVIGGAADRSGVVDLGLPGGGSSGNSSVQQSAPPPGQSDSGQGSGSGPAQSPNADGPPQLDAKGAHREKGAKETGNGAGKQKATGKGQGNAYGHQHAKGKGSTGAKGPPAHAPGAAKEKHTGPPANSNKGEAKPEQRGAGPPSSTTGNSKSGSPSESSSNSQAGGNSQSRSPTAHSQGKSSHPQSTSQSGGSRSSGKSASSGRGSGHGGSSKHSSSGAAHGKSRSPKPAKKAPRPPREQTAK